MSFLDDTTAGLNAHLNVWLYLDFGLSILTISLVTKTIHNLFFHPLRAFPGPLSHRASVLPFLYHSLAGRAAFHTHDLHETYGPVVRLTPNHLSFTDVRAWKDIYGHRTPHQQQQQQNQPNDTAAGGPELLQDREENPKSRLHTGFFPDLPPSILDVPRREHAALRKALSYGFSESSLRKQEGRIRRYVDLLVRRLAQQQDPKNEPVDMSKYFNWAAFDIVGDLVFADDEGFGCLERCEYHPFMELIVGTLRGGAALVVLNYLGLGFLMKVAWRLGVGRLVEKMRGALKEKIRRRVELQAAREEAKKDEDEMGGEDKDDAATGWDLFEGLMRNRVELGLNINKLASNATILVAAGSESPATLLSGAVYLLLSHPTTLTKLTAEVRSAFSAREEITVSAVNTRLPYLLAVLNEALRMYPTVTGGMVRVISGKGLTVAGRYYVPGGTMVECSPWAMNHSSAHWEDPCSFTPERWLHSNSPESEQEPDVGRRRDTLEAMQSFSVGPRSCIGRNFAYAEMRLVLANLVYSFDLRLADESRGWIEKQRAYPLWNKGPLYVYVEPVSK